MKPATKEMIRLALTADGTIPSDIVQTAPDIIERAANGNPPSDDGQPLLMTMVAAAKHLGVGRTTLWRMVKEGILKPVEITPGVHRISRRELEQFLERENQC